MVWKKRRYYCRSTEHIASECEELPDGDERLDQFRKNGRAIDHFWAPTRELMKDTDE